VGVPDESFPVDIDCAESGCVVCNASVRELGRSFARQQLPLATDDEVRHSFAESGGYCPTHMWQFVAWASPLGLARTLNVFADRLSRDLTDTADVVAMLEERWQEQRDAATDALIHMVGSRARWLPPRG